MPLSISSADMFCTTRIKANLWYTVSPAWSKSSCAIFSTPSVGGTLWSVRARSGRITRPVTSGHPAFKRSHQWPGLSLISTSRDISGFDILAKLRLDREFIQPYRFTFTLDSHPRIEDFPNSRVSLLLSQSNTRVPVSRSN